MPLKKPARVPKIPKTRTKKVEAARDAIPAKKEDKIEYSCSVSFRYDAMRKIQNVLFNIQTMVLFTSFAYEISVDVTQEKREIFITLTGLQTRTNYIPTTEPAAADILFEDLFGQYTVHVLKLDGTINSAVFEFNVYKKEIQLIEKFLPEKKNNRWFCDFAVDESRFTFPE